MAGKKVVPAEVRAGKLRAAVAARHNPQTFIIARTDALAPLGMDEALRRAELRPLTAGRRTVLTTLAGGKSPFG